MNEQFELLRITRENIINALSGLSHSQFNQIPEGFSNNIIWNAGHILVTQQLLMYKLSGVDCEIPSHLIDKYRKGSRPEEEVSTEEITTIIQLLAITTDQVREDYNSKHFGEYTEYTTSYNATLKTVEDAIRFNNVHEGLHFGYIMALKHCV